ncbi:type IV toxin-antitoxin system AbiEi family antitoxin domain-containing protein [Arthrobacter sp. UYEF3]|uniref:type IV toxin-antitoxin system AbiEi family antitoxin domain-containing protein n=1 Tax=Arthrobacter sp. UYEF3 TaxID=1756365 RepID=UPI0033992053
MPPELPAAGDLWRTDQLLASGLNSRAIARLVQGAALVRLRRGCYARGHWWRGLNATARRRQLISAHALGTLTTSTGGFAYSHVSGASLRGLQLWNADNRVHFTQQGRPSGISHGREVVAHTRLLSSREICYIDGLPCTSLERTVIDCCLMFTVPQAVILVDHAARIGADLGLLRTQCSVLVGRNGVVTLRRALELADPRSESAGESRTRELLHRLGIAPPELQFRVPTPFGEYRLDFAWPERKVALEFDGKSKYFDYQPTGDVLFAERRREKALMEQGWTFLRIEWKDLFNEVEFKYRVLRAFRNGAAADASPIRRFRVG